MAGTINGSGGSSATRGWRRRGAVQVRRGLATTVVTLVADGLAMSTRGCARRRQLSVVSLFLVCALMSVLPVSPTKAQTAPKPGPPGSPLASPPAPDLTSPPATPLPASSPPASADPTSVLGALPTPSGYRAGVELMDRRTETSKTFTGDHPGELKTELYAGAKHFKDAKGAWMDIDTELSASKGGKRQNKANSFALTVADSSAEGALASVALDAQHSVGFSLEGAAKVTAIADKSSVTYARTHKDTDVRLTSVRTGLKEELVLHSTAAPDRFVFPLELKGLTASIDEGGDIVYRDAAGTERARTPHGFMTDANVDARSGQGPMSRGVTYALVPHTNGVAIEVLLDRAWLDDPARAYPVTVDPEIKTGAGADDTYVSSAYPTTNSSYAGDLHIGTYNSGGDVRQGYVRFDTAPLNGAIVQWAALVMAERSSWDCSRQPGPVYRITSDWNGRNITWNNRPPVDPTAYSGVMAGMNACPNRSGVWEITPAVAHWAANPAQSFGLFIRTVENDNLAWKTWSSTEGGGPPRLDVTYNHQPLNAADVKPAQYGRVVPPGINTASAIYSDPNSTAGQVAFWVRDTAGNTLWSAWSAQVCSGCRATVTLPDLAEGWYYLSAIGYDGQHFSPAWTGPTYYFVDRHAPDVPTDVIPAAGAVVSNPITVSARYSEYWTWPGHLLFVVNDTAGQQVTHVWKPVPQDPADPNNPQLCSGCVGTTTLPNLANGTYDVYTYAYDGAWSPGVVRRITVVDGPTTTTSSTTTTTAPTTTTTTVPPPPAAASGAGAMGYYSFDSYGLTDTLSAHVNVGTGNLMISGADASVAVVGGAKGIGRTYNSASLNPGYAAPTSPVLGPGWRFSESPDHRLVPNADGSVTYVTPSGATPAFTGSSLSAPAGFDATLVREGDGTFTLSFPASADVLRFGADGLLSSETDRNGNVLTVDYPAGGGHPTTITGNAGVASARTVTVDYGGPAGKIASLSRTADGVTASVGYGYDAAGRLETVTDAEGGLTTFVYDPANRITRITDAAGHVTRFTYDAAGRVATVTREVTGADAVTTYDYTSTPGHTKVTDPNNNPLTDFTFFPDGRMDKALNARGVTSQVLWTPDLTVLEVRTGVEPTLGTLITNVWDAVVTLNLTKVVSATKATSEVGGYGSGVTARLPGWTTDTLGNQTSYGYDAKGNLNAVTSPVTGSSSLTHNPDGTVATSTTPANPANPTVYGYTDHQRTLITPPTGSSLAATSATYDGFGRLRTSVSGEGVTTTFGYDKLDRIRTQSHSDATPTITYDYDAAGNTISRGDATGTTTHSYDQANRPLSKTTPAGVLSYGWDRAGNLTTATDPTGTTTYHYDIVNRLDQVTEPVTGRKDVFAYDDMGRRTDSWFNTGTDVAYLGNTVIVPASFAVHTKASYDADSQLVGLKTTRASSDADANRVSELCYSYTFTVPAGSACPNPATGTPTNIRHSVTDALTAKTTNYSYDAAGRLTSAATADGPTYAYGFDANTNRTSGPEGAHSVNSGDQLTDTGFAYNADGGLTAGGGLSALAYNGIAQTTSITPVGRAATAYTYAGGGQAERTTSDPATADPTTALHGMQGLVMETTAGATTSYIRGPGGALIAERTPVGDFYYVYDGHGSVIALVEPGGAQRAAYTYDPYGDHATATAMNGELPPNPWRWSGSYLDATGLYKMGARYYDPTLGRFTQVDPVGGGSCNNYDYACGDPVNGHDASGLAMERISKLDDACGFGSSYDSVAISSDDCVRYRNAVVTGMSDYYVYGELRPVQHDFNKALHRICSKVEGPARFAGIGGFGRTIAGDDSFGNKDQTVMVGSLTDAAGKATKTRPSRAIRAGSPYVTAAATVADAGCEAVNRFG